MRLPGPEGLAHAEAVLAKAKGAALTSPEQAYASETVLMKEFPQQVSLVIQAMRMGDLRIAAVPCEVFAETGLAMKQRSPFKPTPENVVSAAAKRRQVVFICLSRHGRD